MLDLDEILERRRWRESRPIEIKYSTEGNNFLDSLSGSQVESILDTIRAYRKVIDVAEPSSDPWLEPDWLGAPRVDFTSYESTYDSTSEREAE